MSASALPMTAAERAQEANALVARIDALRARATEEQAESQIAEAVEPAVISDGDWDELLNDKPAPVSDPLPLVPQQLKALPNWVTFESASKKAPIISGTLQNAKSNDSKTWVDYQTACKNIAEGRGYTGLGFVTDGANSHNLIGFDLDGCRNPATGELTEWAERIAAELSGTYGEITVSGTGLRFWVIAPSFRKHADFKMAFAPLYNGKNQVLEIFGDGLYFTVSGNRLPNRPSEVLTLDESRINSILALAKSLAVVEQKLSKPAITGYTPQKDEGFEKLFDVVGWKPMFERMNKMGDTRFHDISLDAGKLTYCPMPEHQPRGTQYNYTPCFGALADAAGVVHCFGCKFTGDMVKTVFEFDAGEDGGQIQHKNMYECARAICVENALNFEEFFPPVQTLSLNQQPTETPVVPQGFLGARVEGGDDSYVIAPTNLGDEGWFPRGDISLTGGYSGAGKTTLILDMLEKQARGEFFFGRETYRLPYLVMLADRSPRGLRRTMKRMKIDLKTLPHARHNGGNITDAIEKELVARQPMPAIVFLEGIDLMGDSSKGQDVATLLRELARIADHYFVAIVGSTGSPKVKKGDGYKSAREMFIGSSSWARLVETMVLLQRENETAELTDMVVLPRQSKPVSYTLRFEDGRLREATQEEAKKFAPAPTSSQGKGESARELAIEWYTGLFKNPDGTYKQEVLLKEHQSKKRTLIGMTRRSLADAREFHGIGYDPIKKTYIAPPDWGENDVKLE